MNYLNLLKDFRSLGCTNEAQTTAACQLFIDLCDVRRLTVSDDDGYVECFYLASSSNATLDLTATEKIKEKLTKTHSNECKDFDNVQLMLGIVDPNTTIVYYKLSLGLMSLGSLKEERSLFQQKTLENEPKHQPSSSRAMI